MKYILRGMGDDLTPKTESEMIAFRKGCTDMREIQRKGNRDILIVTLALVIPTVVIMILMIILLLI
jgi:hypothetical protein